MPINEGLANLSHYAFVVTVMAYAVAVLAFACDFAFGRHAIGPLKAAKEQAADLRRGGLGPAGRRSGDAGAPARHRRRRALARPGRVRVGHPAGRDRRGAGCRGDGALGAGGRRLTVARAGGAHPRGGQPRARRAPGAVGRHVRVRHHGHLRGGHLLPLPHVPLPRLPPGPVRDRPGGDPPRARGDRHLHPGRAARRRRCSPTGSPST